MAAMALMNNGLVDDAQCIFVSASCSNNNKASALSKGSPSNDYIKTIKYEGFAAVFWQMDGGKGSNNSSSATFISNTATTCGLTKDNGNKNFKSFKNRKFMTIQDAIESKRKTKCKTFQIYGHLSSDHKKDGTIRFNLSSSPTLITVTSNSNNSINQHNSPAPTNNEKNTFKIGNACIISTAS